MRRDLGLLPDEILLRVLSFLNTKQAVQSTSISKRWVNLWTFLPNLNFVSSDFQNTPSFNNFVDKVLTLRHELALIKTLWFSSNGTTTYQFLERIISYTVTRGLEHLSIAINHLQGDDTSSWLPSINTILTLKIFVSNTLFRYPNASNFEKLVTLYIDHARLVQSDAFSGCPNLTNLTLINCQMVGGVNHLHLTGTRLLKLTIASYGKPFGDVVLVIFSSRQLKFLKIEGIFPLWFTILESSQSNDCLPQIDEIYFDNICDDFDDLSNQSKKRVHYFLTKMLIPLQKAKYVTLSTATIEILAYDLDTLAQQQFHFCNLKSLTLVSSYYRWSKNFKLPLSLMDYFVQSSPQADVIIDFQQKTRIDQQNMWNR